MTAFNDTIKAKLEALLGERGVGNDAAVRRKDINGILEKAAAIAVAKAEKAAKVKTDEAISAARRAEKAVESLRDSLANPANTVASSETAQNDRLFEAMAELFKWNGSSYTLRVPAIDVIGELSVDYSMVIESSLGTVFRVGEARTTTFTARVFRNGEEVTADIPDSWFCWRRLSMLPQPYPNDDETWNSIYGVGGYKTISVNVDAVFGRATFFCDLQPPA